VLDVCVDVILPGVNNAEDVVVLLADASPVTAADEVEVEPMPFAANSDLTRLKYV